MSFYVRCILILFFVLLAIIQLSQFVGEQSPYPAVLYVAKSITQDEVRLLDLQTGFERTLTQHESIGILDVAPTGDILVTTHAQVGSILNILHPITYTLTATVHGIDDNPMWSPSADRVAYRRYYYQGGLYVFTRGEWPPRPLDIRATAISWSPDGTVLAYSRWSEIANQEEIRIIDPITRNDSLLAGWRKPVRFMRWSPDGSQIALVTISGELYMLDLATQEFTPLWTESGQVRMIQWTPDGRFLGVAYTKNRQTTLRIYSANNQLRDEFTLPQFTTTSSFDWYRP